MREHEVIIVQNKYPCIVLPFYENQSLAIFKHLFFSNHCILPCFQENIKDWFQSQNAYPAYDLLVSSVNLTLQADTKWGGLKAGQVMAEPKPIFTKIELKREGEDSSVLAQKTREDGKQMAQIQGVAEAQLSGVVVATVRMQPKYQYQINTERHFSYINNRRRVQYSSRPFLSCRVEGEAIHIDFSARKMRCI